MQRTNLTKKDLINSIYMQIGFSNNISENLIDDLLITIIENLKKDKKLQSLPLFISEVDGKKQYIIPLRGKGLWGPIWGFISLEDDLNKVFGAVFDHKSETPGLGAEINQPFFEDPFSGKSIFDGEELKSIKVIKE